MFNKVGTNRQTPFYFKDGHLLFQMAHISFYILICYELDFKEIELDKVCNSQQRKR